MNKLKIADDIIPALLVDSRFRICRHILLFIIISVITLNFIWYIPEKYTVNFSMLYGWIIYMLVFVGAIYANLYIFVPYLLLKNRLLLYLLSLIFMVFLTLFCILFVQQYFFKINNMVETEKQVLSIDILNISSAIVAFSLLFMGTTAFFLLKNWITYNQHIDELESATLNSELKILKSQINPHFLFNMLNNANIMVDEDPDTASEILTKLEDMLRYQIDDSSKDKVSLSADIQFLTRFLDLEKTRRDYFGYTISEEGNIGAIEVPPLLFIPFVENAVKHNSDSDNASYVHLHFNVDHGCLYFICENSKPKKPEERAVGGLGLINIRRRLDLLYGKNYALEINITDSTYTVNLQLNLL
ncbi:MULTISPECIES: sensor histidine kinase [Dysgonomonas]|uniref:Signal transduction histidine kinase internal region domain-containing protein n=2 Tax=Dysgonomonas gadei TaxID=156974 RepID=F5ITF9_9BACT|nr:MULTISPECIES: histidine kinase [Dysgonomonas]EGJ99343.1 hypothetical protein HMPREF9455_00376 [Dysgonomonas gadei ATCC BAA-286]MBF0647604.1 histidine kinase [Dysgonomonas sp. GY75]